MEVGDAIRVEATGEDVVDMYAHGDVRLSAPDAKGGGPLKRAVTR